MSAGKVILETRRLRLREMTEADAPNLVGLNSNPNVVRYVEDGPLAGPDAALEVLRRRIFSQYREFGVGRWAVIVRAEDRYIGWCGLKYLRETNEYDLGYRLLENHWGHGYASEAAEATLRWGRARFSTARLFAQADVRNLRSIRVMEKIGLRFEENRPSPTGPIAIYVAPLSVETSLP